jgi:hypothetical protein
MQIVPISDVPSQILSVSLNGQSCRLRIFTRRSSIYMDIFVNDVLLVAGARCRNFVPIARDVYLGFSGELVFRDLQGTTDPASPGLNTRYQLVYLSADDMAGIA